MSLDKKFFKKIRMRDQFKYIVKIIYFEYFLRFFLKKPKYKLHSLDKIVSNKKKLSTKTVVHMIWIHGELTQIEMMCINSFIKNGFEVNFWTFEKIYNIPKKTKIRNLNQFCKKNFNSHYLDDPGYILQSDILRIKILYKYGGLYSDTDNICAIKEKKFSKKFIEPFLCTEMNHQMATGVCINNNLMYFPKPKHPFLDFVNNFSKNFLPKTVSWALYGGRFFDLLAKNFPNFAPKIMNTEFANPIPYWRCPDIFFYSNIKLPKGMAFLHLYNERWRVRRINKSDEFPKKSIVNFLLKKYNN
jgi:hypothetical protein